MKRNLKRWYGLVIVLVLAAVIALCLVAPAFAGSTHATVLPPTGTLYGKTLGQWCAAWWQWEFAYPVTHSPAYDDTGALAGLGQHGPVWMLAGDFSGTGPTRTFTVPCGKALLVSVISVEASNLEAPPFYGANPAQMRAAIADPMFDYGALTATVDGWVVPHLWRYLVESPPYIFYVPNNNTLGVAAGFGRSVAKGCFFMLAPLPSGKHVIHVYGEFPNLPFSEVKTYDITVVPNK